MNFLIFLSNTIPGYLLNDLDGEMSVRLDNIYLPIMCIQNPLFGYWKIVGNQYSNFIAKVFALNFRTLSQLVTKMFKLEFSIYLYLLVIGNCVKLW